MSLQEWQKNGWLKPHTPTVREIQSLFEVVERDLRVGSDARTDPDWRFVAAYNAALQCASIALLASGFRVPKGGGAHHRTIESLRLTIAADSNTIDTLQAFRSKRAGAVYEAAGIASETEISELCNLASDLRDRVRAWLKQHHPGLTGGERRK